MHRLSVYCLFGLFSLCLPSQSAVFRFDTDPFVGSTALTTPGRQIVGGEDLINFSIATDVFSLESTAFGVAAPVLFVNDLSASLPASGVNVIVLHDTPDPFNAGLAANLIAAQITTPGPGFFIYFNSGLGVPRLVYSADLDDSTADLKVLFRLTNLGSADLPSFTASNFEITTVPEPSAVSMVAGAGVLLAARGWWHRGRRPRTRTAPRS